MATNIILHRSQRSPSNFYLHVCDYRSPFIHFPSCAGGDTVIVTQFPRYIFEWMEIILFICSIVFVWVFHADCLCPLTWQWQIGVVAVFLGWIDLISKFPLTGIYVLMFVKILYTFLKMLIVSILLVLAFGLTFYLAFGEPKILVYYFLLPRYYKLTLL